MSTHPTIVLVHGAYHGPWCYSLVIPKLEALGYPVIAIDSPTTSSPSATTAPLDDVAEIHKHVLPLLDAGKEVVLAAHSYGGIPTYLSAIGQSVAERAKENKKGGVRSVVFLCAFALPNGVYFLHISDSGMEECGLHMSSRLFLRSKSSK